MFAHPRVQETPLCSLDPALWPLGLKRVVAFQRPWYFQLRYSQTLGSPFGGALGSRSSGQLPLIFNVIVLQRWETNRKNCRRSVGWTMHSLESRSF